MCTRRSFARRVLLVLAVGSAFVFCGGKTFAQSGKQDCIVNSTGMPVWVTMVWINQVIDGLYLEANDSFAFGVPDTSITIALVAYTEDGQPVTVTTFASLPQDPPPALCFAITPTAAKEGTKRQKAPHDKVQRGLRGFRAK